MFCNNAISICCRKKSLANISRAVTALYTYLNTVYTSDKDSVGREECWWAENPGPSLRHNRLSNERNKHCPVSDDRCLQDADTRFNNRFTIRSNRLGNDWSVSICQAGATIYPVLNKQDELFLVIEISRVLYAKKIQWHAIRIHIVWLA